MAIIFNQNNYNNPYPAPGYLTATIKSGGCGPTAMAMIVSNLTGQTVDPPAMAQFAIKCGARVSGGTDMDVLAKATCKEFGLTCQTTNDESVLLQHLNNGGMAIANVGGNRPGYTGVFSDGGHYVVVYGVNGSKVVVLDPGYYVGKFDKPGRADKVSISGDYYLVTDISILAQDTASRSPQYWLFSKATEYIPANVVVWGRPLEGKHVLFAGQDRVCAMAAQVADVFGVQCQWQGETNTLIFLPYQGPALAYTEQPKVCVAGQLLPAINIQGHIWVPVGLIGKAYDRQVQWDGPNNTAIIG